MNPENCQRLVRRMIDAARIDPDEWPWRELDHDETTELLQEAVRVAARVIGPDGLTDAAALDAQRTAAVAVEAAAAGSPLPDAALPGSYADSRAVMHTLAWWLARTLGADVPAFVSQQREALLAEEIRLHTNEEGTIHD